MRLANARRSAGSWNGDDFSFDADKYDNQAELFALPLDLVQIDADEDRAADGLARGLAATIDDELSNDPVAFGELDWRNTSDDDLPRADLDAVGKNSQPLRGGGGGLDKKLPIEYTDTVSGFFAVFDEG